MKNRDMTTSSLSSLIGFWDGEAQGSNPEPHLPRHQTSTLATEKRYERFDTNHQVDTAYM